MTDSLLFTFGSHPADLARLRDMQGRFYSSMTKMPKYVQMELGMLASDLARAIRKEFERHNKTGRTIKSLRINLDGFTAVISMGGGAVFVQFGSGPHFIVPRKEGGVLAYVDSSGSLFFSKRVQSPGYVGDPFLDRARDSIKLEHKLRQFASWIFQDITGVAPVRVDSRLYSMGELYTGRAAGISI